MFVELSSRVGREPAEVGGETERRAVINGVEELMRLNGSLEGREPGCDDPGKPVLAGTELAARVPGVAAEDEARITAAAALGAERLLRGTSGA